MALSRKFDTVRYVDLDNGNDANNGTTNALAWRTLGKVVTALFPGGSGTGTRISVEVILAGTSGATNATSTGLDQFTYDASSRTGVTEVGIRMWTAADGARPSSGVIGRPLLRADNPFTSLTQIGATAVYKSNNITPGGTVIIGQVLFKPGQLSQLDADGAWKCHIDFTTSTEAVDATVATAVLAAGANTGIIRTTGGQTQIFVNTTGLTGGTTASNWGWCADQVVANFSKIRPIGFDYVGVQDVDTLYGERGIVVFDSGKPCIAEIRGCRAYEHGVHGILCSYSSSGLQNITFDGCEVYGLGSSSTGNTMLAATGQSGNFDSYGVRITNCKTRRYMLQNPSGAKYKTAQYPIIPIGVGTSAAVTSGKVTDALISGCIIEDVTTAKTMTTRGEPMSAYRCAVPVDRTAHNSYPVRFENCYISTLGTWLTYQDTNYGDLAVSFKNCRILLASPDATLFSWSVRTGWVFFTPATAGTTQYIGMFNNDFRVDIGLGDSTNTFAGIGPNNNSGAGAGLRHYFTARDSTLQIVTKANGSSPLFEQNSTNDAANKVLFLDVQNCDVGCVTPLGSPITNCSLVQRDLPASGNTSRIFLNNDYFNIRQDAWSTANATYAGFVTNVDPYAYLDNSASYVTPNFAPAAPSVRRRPIIIQS